jgi:ACS family hexuronate transporter-like MFS transporter
MRVCGKPRISKVWLICGLLFCATVLNYMDRQTLAITAPLIQRELGLDNSRFGLLLSAFFYSYGCMQVVVGFLLDRVSVRWGYALALLWWSAAGAATGFARTFDQLFACRTLLGVGEAANWPAALRIVSRVVPPEKRSVANGIFNSGSSAGAVITPLLMIWLSTRWNWRVGFIVIGGLAAVWVALWIWVTRSSPSLGGPESISQSGAATAKEPSSWPKILRAPRFWGLMVASAFANPCYYFYSSWLPSYFVQEKAIAFGTELGNLVTVPFLGLGLGSALGGLPAVYLSRNGMRPATARTILLGICTLCMTSVCLVTAIQSTPVLLALIFMVTLSMGAWMANYLSAVQEVSQRHVSAVSGIIGSVGGFCGALCIWAVGSVSQIAHGFRPVFAVLGMLPIIATLGIVLTPEPRAQTDRLIRSVPASN